MYRLMLATLFVSAAAAIARGQDWIIGAADPNESIVQTADRFVNGNLVLINNASLTIRSGATVTIAGEIHVFNRAVLDVQNAAIHFPQVFAYQYGILAGDDAVLRFTDATIDGAGSSHSVGLVANASAIFERATVQNGFATWAFFENASLQMTDCTNGGEFVPFGNVSVTISGTDTVLFWLAMPDGSVVDTTFPAPGPVASFTLDPNTPWASGIPYSFSLSNSTNVWWGVMARSGASGTFRDSQIRAVGSYFERANAFTISGVANNVTLADTSYQWGDVGLRFVNSSIQSWNFYAAGTTRLTLESCLFGEAQSYADSEMWIIQSLCDGSGGYVFAGDSSALFFVSSTNLSQTTSSGQAIFLSFRSALLAPQIDANQDSLALLLNTESVGEPRAHDRAAIFDVGVDPLSAPAGDTLTLRGSARFISAPQSGFAYDGYSVEYAAAADPNNWIAIAGPSAAQVRDGTLSDWDTCGLAPGDFQVRVSALNNVGPPIRVTSSAVLTPPTVCAPGDVDCDRDIDLSDLAAMLALFGVCNGQPGYDPNADANGDGCIDLVDLTVVLAGFGGTCL